MAMLVDRAEYLSAGVHIGMKSCTKSMKKFVYKIRDDGLAVLNLQMVDERIKTAAAFLSRFGKVMVVARKANAALPMSKFSESTGCKYVAGRFSPGTLTNPSYRDFYEPEVLLVVDPLVDEQAMKEAVNKRIPIIALCDTFNEVKNVDFIVPVNNNGRKSLALIFWLFTKEILKSKKKKFDMTVEDFGGGGEDMETDAIVEEEQKAETHGKKATPGKGKYRKAEK
jgi:small subunit ribosomal protein S2